MRKILYSLLGIIFLLSKSYVDIYTQIIYNNNTILLEMGDAQ